MPKLLKLPFLFLLVCVREMVHLVIFALALILLPFDLAWAWSKGRCIKCRPYLSRFGRPIVLHELPFHAERFIVFLDDIVWRNKAWKLYSILGCVGNLMMPFFRFMEHFTLPIAPLYRNCRYDSCRHTPFTTEQKRANALSYETDQDRAWERDYLADGKGASLDSFAYDDGGNDTGLRESDFI